MTYHEESFFMKQNQNHKQEENKEYFHTAADVDGLGFVVTETVIEPSGLVRSSFTVTVPSS
eukprot:CAMPEP_0183701920 /NCGR_PEP_ID=MMETSP0737-20130205/161_1 /TAXON_ID=385413 /ORGANISM="Thalassiosira miniscula, Strain CCMP1093" /LENGTH=60 /DNA_ID=CAMNT_0025928429 /DNA_START=156 /DNA_END=334 /DNA_ORIENTATION=-